MSFREEDVIVTIKVSISRIRCPHCETRSLIATSAKSGRTVQCMICHKKLKIGVIAQ